MNMLGDDKIKMWAKAHVFYSLFNQDLGAEKSSGERRESEWRKRLTETPNGRLITENSFFRDLRQSKQLSFLHVTPNLSKIVKSGSLYASSGCLIGGIYTAPLSREGKKFRVHNLGEYILKAEAPKASYLQSKAERPSALVIEIDLPSQGHDNLIGIDYVRMGEVHLRIYQELEYLLSFEERANLQETLINRVKSSLRFLSMVNRAFERGREPDGKTFWDYFIAAIDQLPILGYLYFEVVSEYLLLHQDNPAALLSHAVGEFHNADYKNLMFDFYPSLLKGAGLGVFKPSPTLLTEYVAQKKLISRFNPTEMLAYLVSRIIFLANARLLSAPSTLVEWQNVRWDFSNIVSLASPLVGHLVHRELRSFGRFPDFYFYFDQLKALQIWNYWNHMGVVIPFNGVIPKGETGINPACPNLSYRIYRGRIITRNASPVYVQPDEQIDAKIVPRLVHLRFATMRNRERNSLMS